MLTLPLILPPGHADSVLIVSASGGKDSTTTGETIVATVPLPPSGDRHENKDGLVVARRMLDAIEVQRHLPTARVDVFTAEGALVGHVAPVDEAAPSTSPAPEVPHPYGEGLW